MLRWQVSVIARLKCVGSFATAVINLPDYRGGSTSRRMRQSPRAPNIMGPPKLQCKLVFTKIRNIKYRKYFLFVQLGVPEWLSNMTRNCVGFACVSSNPVSMSLFHFPKLISFTPYNYLIIIKESLPLPQLSFPHSLTI